MYTQILVPVDGSEASIHALSEAIDLAKSGAGRLRLLHVVKAPVLDYRYSSEDSSRQQVLVSLRQIGRSILNKAELTVRQQHLTPECMLFETLEGSVARVILDQAACWAADLIVMGVHPRRGGLGIGSTTAEVLSESRGPVLLVRGAPMPQAAAEHRVLEYAATG